MNKNILIAATASLCFHGTLALYSYLQHHVSVPASASADEKTIRFELPQIPPEPVQPDDSDESGKGAQNDYTPAPPSLPPPENPAPSSVTEPPHLNPPGPTEDAPVIPTIDFPGEGGGIGNTPIVPLGLLSRQPEPVLQFPPQYPYELRHNGIEGKVLVSFVVDDHGYVHNAVAEEGSHPEFASAAAAAVSKWRFRPGMKDGRAVATRMQLPALFNLDSKP